MKLKSHRSYRQTTLIGGNKSRKKKRSLLQIVIMLAVGSSLVWIGFALAKHNATPTAQPQTQRRKIIGIPTSSDASKDPLNDASAGNDKKAVKEGEQNADSGNAQANDASDDNVEQATFTPLSSNAIARQLQQKTLLQLLDETYGNALQYNTHLSNTTDLETPPDISYEYYLTALEPDFGAGPEGRRLAALATATAYTARTGDFLGKIATDHKCSVEAIRIANRLTNDQIQVGQKLLIPDCTRQKDNLIALVKAQKQEKTSHTKRGAWWKRKGVDSKGLTKLMKKHNFKPPKKFMAFVLEITFDKTRSVITRERAFDWQGSSKIRDGWNPASSVKLFAAIGVLYRLEELGFSSSAKVTFHSKSETTTRVSDLIKKAIIQSDNIAYNRLVQLAGFDTLHEEVLSKRYGMTNTGLNRGYYLSKWTQLGEDPSLRQSPKMTIEEGSRKKIIPAKRGKSPAVCGASACTTLQDLGESTRRLMLQEQLPKNESFSLKRNDLIMLRVAMRHERTRGDEVINIFERIFNDPRVRFYSKPGFSEDWYSDNVYIFDPRFNQAWIVVMAGYPGRNSLNEASRIIATIIQKGELRKLP